MAQATVFVDDAVRGTLPSICVKDGVATTDQLVVQDELGDRSSLGVGWLLLLLGPLGWIGLLLMMVSRSGRGELLTVKLPMSDLAYQRLRAARRLRTASAAAAVGVVVVALLAAPSGGFGGSGRIYAVVAVAALVAAVVTLLVADARVTAGTVQVDLDASRRWVTFSRVHPTFAAACQAQEQRQSQRT